MSLTDVHARLATSMLLFLGVAGLWGIGSSLLKRGMTPAYWGLLAIGELLILAQAIVGAALWLEGARPARGIHLLYGAVALLTLPGYFAYSRGQENPRTAQIYGLICLFLVGISLRAMGTAT
jgi:hypothetical protein